MQLNSVLELEREREGKAGRVPQVHNPAERKEREREREIYIYICICMYIYIYQYFPFHTEPGESAISR